MIPAERGLCGAISPSAKMALGLDSEGHLAMPALDPGENIWAFMSDRLSSKPWISHTRAGDMGAMSYHCTAWVEY